MPKIENINQFKSILKEVAKEPEILSQRGLPDSDVSPLKEGESVLPWQEIDSKEVDPSYFDLKEKEGDTPDSEEELTSDSFLDSSQNMEEFPSGEISEDEVVEDQKNNFDDALDNLLEDYPIQKDSNFNELTEETTKESKSENDPMEDNFIDDMNNLFSDNLEENKLSLEPNIDSPENKDILDNNEFSQNNINDNENLFDFGSEDQSHQENGFDLESENLDSSFALFQDKDEAFSESETDTPFRLSPEEYKIFYDKISSFPKNLRLAVAEVAASSDMQGSELKAFIDKVVKEQNFRKLARISGDILGRVIILPNSYYRAIDLAKREKTFTYNFYKTAWPILQKGLLLNAILFLFLFFSFKFGLEPWQAKNYYQLGLEAIEKGNKKEAEEFFKRGYAIKAWDDWFFRYAEAYKNRRDYESAIRKYEELLTQYPFSLGADKRKRTHFNKKAYLEYSQLRNFQGLYQQADDLLQQIISEHVQDYEAWLARGDNYMDWAKEDPIHYDDALRSYSSLLSFYGDSLISLSRILNYYVQIDNEEEAYKLFLYIKNKGYPQIDAKIYTEYASYLLKKDQNLLNYSQKKSNIKQVGQFSEGQQSLVENEFSYIPNKERIYLGDIYYLLTKVLENQEDYIPAYFYLSRYYHRIQNTEQQKKSLKEVIRQLFYKNSLTEDESKISILSFKDLGLLTENEQDSTMARQYYQKGIDLYESQTKLGTLKKSSELAEIFALQGGSYYKSYQDEQAKLFYERAIEEGFSNPEVIYSLGNIFYREKDFPQAIKQFFDVELTPSLRVNPNLLYSMANALAEKGEKHSARGYYLQLLSLLEQKREGIENLDLNNINHKMLIERSIQTLNNLGVVELEIASQSYDESIYGEGLKHLAKSEELFDIYHREGSQMQKSIVKSLSAINLKESWSSKDPSNSLKKYIDLPRFLEIYS